MGSRLRTSGGQGTGPARASVLGGLVIAVMTAACAMQAPRVGGPLVMAASHTGEESPADGAWGQGLFVQALVEHQRGNLSEALRLANQVIGQSRDALGRHTKRAYLLRAQCHLEMGDEGAARSDLEACARLDPLWPLPQRVVGSYFLERHRFEDALEAFTAAVRLEPGEASGWNGLGLAWVGCAAEIEPGACLWASRIRGRMFRKAGRAFRRAIDADPGWQEPFFNHSVVSAVLGVRDQAIADLDDLQGRFGADESWWRRLAVATVGLTRPSESVWYLEQALSRVDGSQNTTRAALARGIARLLMGQGRLEAARPYVVLCLEVTPDDVEVLLWAADIDALAGRIDEAARAYRAVFDGGDLEMAERALVGLASLVGEHGDRNLAFELLDAGLRAGLHSPPLLALLGQVAEETGKNDVALEASSALVTAAAEQPRLLDDAAYLRSVAARLIQSRLDGIGDLDRACDVLTALVQVAPASPELTRRIMGARRLVGDPAQRRAILLDLLESLPVTPAGVAMVGRW